jgi:hypothetical protein
MKIEAGRYKAGWMRLSVGGSKRRAAAFVAGIHTGSLGWGASLGVVGDGDGDGRGPDDRAADAPPVAFRRGGSLLPPSVNRHGPVDGNGTVGIRSGRVTGVISW